MVECREKNVKCCGLAGATIADITLWDYCFLPPSEHMDLTTDSWPIKYHCQWMIFNCIVHTWMRDILGRVRVLIVEQTCRSMLLLFFCLLSVIVGVQKDCFHPGLKIPVAGGWWVQGPVLVWGAGSVQQWWEREEAVLLDSAQCWPAAAHTATVEGDTTVQCSQQQQPTPTTHHYLPQQPQPYCSTAALQARCRPHHHSTHTCVTAACELDSDKKCAIVKRVGVVLMC